MKQADVDNVLDLLDLFADERGGEREQACFRAAAVIRALAADHDRYRDELRKVNNEFGEQSPDWPDAWLRVADLKKRSNDYWRELEELRRQTVAK